MRTLDEITEKVFAGETPTEDELFYAVAVFRHLLHQYTEDLTALIERGNPQLKPLLEAHSERTTEAARRPPRLWLGPMNDPRCPEYQEWRREQLDVRRRQLH